MRIFTKERKSKGNKDLSFFEFPRGLFKDLSHVIFNNINNTLEILLLFWVDPLSNCVSLQVATFGRILQSVYMC